MPILRRCLLLFGVVFVIGFFFACADTNNSEPQPFDVFAVDKTVTYDGGAHSIDVVNALNSDVVLYSLDGVSFSSTKPAFVLPDVYTVYFRVSRSGYSELSFSATLTITKSVLSGISAPNVTVIYDGAPHGFSIFGTEYGDTILYSLDGNEFSTEQPKLSDVGVYRVFYRIDRTVSEFRSSCTVTILPNIRGRYFNPSLGIVAISDTTAVVNGVLFPLEFDCDAHGNIGEAPFYVSDTSLHYSDAIFTLLAPNDYVYRMDELYFVGGAEISLDVRFAPAGADIVFGSDVLASVPDVNYCDGMSTDDFLSQTFSVAVTADSDVTEVVIPLLNLDEQALPEEIFCRYIYDGSPHGLVVDNGDFVYVDATAPSFVAVGVYSVDVLFLSEGYLPTRRTCTVVILPALDGVYVSDNTVIEIRGERLTINGTETTLTSRGADWLADGMPITVVDGGISIDNVTYTEFDGSALVFDVYGNAYVFTAETFRNIVITSEDDMLTVTLDGTSVAELAADNASVFVYVNGKAVDAMPPQASSDAVMFVIGQSELTNAVTVIVVSSDEGK